MLLSFFRTFHQESIDFQIHRNQVNAKHFLRFIKYVISFEVFFLVVALISLSNNIRPDFNYPVYIGMYILLILVSLFMRYLVTKEIKKPNTEDPRSFYRLTITYIVFFFLWGTAISLIDQPIYGNLNAYYINITAIMSLIYLSKKSTLWLYIGSVVILFILLPFFQSDQDVLNGHFVNTFVFITFMVVASYLHHRTFEKQYRTNSALQQQIVKNKAMQLELEDMVAKLERLVIQDELTGLPNRRGLEDFIARIKITQLPKDLPVSLMMIDIDYFKNFNDTYGHVQGDNALRIIAKELSSVVTSLHDYLIRYGGEEFLMMCVGRDISETKRLANSLCKRVEARGIPHTFSSCKDVVTISVGVTAFTINDIASLSTHIERADQALYLAKASGKNKTCTVD